MLECHIVTLYKKLSLHLVIECNCCNHGYDSLICRSLTGRRMLEVYQHVYRVRRKLWSTFFGPDKQEQSAAESSEDAPLSEGRKKERKKYESESEADEGECLNSRLYEVFCKIFHFLNERVVFIFQAEDGQVRVARRVMGRRRSYR